MVLLILLSSFARAEWRFAGETGVVYNSNLSNSDRSADVRDDWAWRSDISAGNGLQLTRDVRLNLGADLRGELWDRFGAFNTNGCCCHQRCERSAEKAGRGRSTRQTIRSLRDRSTSGHAGHFPEQR